MVFNDEFVLRQQIPTMFKIMAGTQTEQEFIVWHKEPIEAKIIIKTKYND